MCDTSNTTNTTNTTRIGSLSPRLLTKLSSTKSHNENNLNFIKRLREREFSYMYIELLHKASCN